jgi:hypothetical protein
MCWTCINCGHTWGSDDIIDSHGLCRKCLTDKLKQKQLDKGYTPCFGYFNSMGDNCNKCSMREVCSKYSGDVIE